MYVHIIVYFCSKEQLVIFLDIYFNQQCVRATKFLNNLTYFYCFIFDSFDSLNLDSLVRVKL